MWKINSQTDNKMKNNKPSEKWKVKVLFYFLVSPSRAESFCLTSVFVLIMVNMSTAVIHPFDGTKIVSENTTLLHPLINVTENTASIVDRNDPVFLATLPWYCQCSNDLQENENESDCTCEGQMLLKIPQILPLITRLTIANAKFKVLKEAGLRKYSKNLKDMWVAFGFSLRYVVNVAV